VQLCDYVVGVLASRGVRHVFGYPGASIIPLMDAIERHPDMSWVLMRHEGSAALAAAAGAKLTGRLAVCAATAGPGATNMATGVLDAHLDRAPVLALTGLVASWKQSRAGFQDVDAARFFGTLIPNSVACGHPDQLPGLLRDSIGHAEQERTVVHLALPANIQTVDVDDGDPRFTTDRQSEILRLQPPPEAAIDTVAADLAGAGDLVIAVGARAVGAGPAIEALAERLGAAIITSLDGKGVIDESHPHCLGVLGIFGSPGVEASRLALQQAAGIVAFGLDDLAPFVVDESGAQVRRVFQCEPDFSSVTHQFHRDRTLCGGLPGIAEQLTSRLAEASARAAVPERDELMPFPPFHERYVHPVNLLRCLGDVLGPDGVVALDVGDHTVWAAHFLQLRRRQRVLVSNRLGTMGFCLPALIAAKLARPQSEVVGICGDGGFQMALGELLTAVQERLEVVLVVFNNGVLRRVVAQQRIPFGTSLLNPDIVGLAKACGAGGAVLDGRSDIESVLRAALQHRGGPFVIDARLDPAVQAPMAKSADGFVPMDFA
jgi:pyruvate oxidase